LTSVNFYNNINHNASSAISSASLNICSYVISYDNAGNLRWRQKVTDGLLISITNDVNCLIYVTGEYTNVSSPSTFYEIPNTFLTPVPLSNPPGSHAGIYNSSGYLQHAEQLCFGNVFPTGITADVTRNYYTTGAFTGLN